MMTPIRNDITTPTDSVLLNYGYEDAAPDARSSSVHASSTTIMHHHHHKKKKKTQERRSSMKESGQPRRRSSIPYRDVIEYVVPGTNRIIRRRSSIGFDNNVTVRSLPPIASSQEVDAVNREDLWFQDEDYNKMKERSLQLVDLVQRYGPNCGFDGSKKKPCIRGLENLISAEEKITNQYKAYKSVLHLQEVQRRNGMYDDHALAESYMMNTNRSKKEAVKLAKHDERIVRSITNTTRSSCRSL